MTLRKYFPISVAVFVAILAVAAYFNAPILPFVIILLFGETLIGLNLEDHKVPRFLASIFKPPKPHAH